MAAHLEVLIDLHAEVMRASEDIGAALNALDGKLLAAIVEERDRARRETFVRALSGVSGMPCAGEFSLDKVREAAPDVDASDSSATIPLERVEHIDACGE